MWATVNIDVGSLDSNPDVQFFDDLLEHISSHHSIDRHRVYLIGMSNGATFAQLLAHARSSTIAAVVAHSGPRLQSLDDFNDKCPMLLIVGSQDLAANSVRLDAEYYRHAGHDVELIEIPGLGHEWSVRQNPMIWRFLSHYNRTAL